MGEESLEVFYVKNGKLIFKIIKKIYILLILIFSGCATKLEYSNLDMNTPLSMSYKVISTAKPNIFNTAISNLTNMKKFKRDIIKAEKYIELNLTKSLNKKFILFKEDDIGSTKLKLKINLSGYGEMDEELKYWLIASGMGEGIIQGMIIYGATQNIWLSSGVSLEEMISEYLSWNGVDWIFGETYAPVTLRIELYDTKNKKLIYSDWFFVTGNDNKLPNKERKNKSIQLLMSLDKVIKDMLKSFDEYCKKYLKI